jgi:hypothetical protein
VPKVSTKETTREVTQLVWPRGVDKVPHIEETRRVLQLVREKIPAAHLESVKPRRTGMIDGIYILRSFS